MWPLSMSRANANALSSGERSGDVCSPWHRHISQVAHWDWGVELVPKVKPEERLCER